MGVEIVTFTCIFVGFGLLTLLARFILKVNEENKRKHDRRRYFASEKGWRYTSKGDRNFEISTPPGSYPEWKIDLNIGEDSSQTSWTAPDCSYADYVLRLQKRMRLPLSREQRAKAAKILTSVVAQFIQIPGNPQRLFIDGTEYTLQQPALRDVFSAITIEPRLTESLINARCEEILLRWLHHSQMTQAERESLSIELGPRGLIVSCSGIAEEPETIGLLVELGQCLVTAYSERANLSRSRANRFDNRAELDRREQGVNIAGIYHS